MKEQSKTTDAVKTVTIPMSLVNDINHALFEADIAMTEFWQVQEKRFAKEEFTKRAVLGALTDKILFMKAAKEKLEEAAITQRRG